MSEDVGLLTVRFVRDGASVVAHLDVDARRDLSIDFMIVNAAALLTELVLEVAAPPAPNRAARRSASRHR